MKMGKTTPCGGWGYLKPKEVFVAWLQKTCAKAWPNVTVPKISVKNYISHKKKS